MKRLEGRVAIVTGAAGGIGRATALRLAEEGAFVLVTDIDDDGGRATVAAVQEQGGNAVFQHHDVTSPESWTAAVQEADRHGGLDILVNNAGSGDLGTIEDTSLKDFEHTMAVDGTSVFLGMKAAVESLTASAHASVINISSIFGTSGGFGTSPAYHAAKGAVRTLTKNTALHWVDRGIRVNSVHPGFIDTPMLAPVKGTPFEQAILDLTPMRRLGRPEDVAAGVAYLASDDAAFVTGAELYIDGGYIAR